ncbi:hypothetical protein EOM86_05755 [Candidatus Nomurabacteria bacterium]|nr:hypothetical protein [Candidatus Nomurabacteria bacterium]
MAREYQLFPHLSLGGYPSRERARADLDYLFGGMSELSRYKPNDNYVCLAVQNVGQAAINNIRVSTTNPAGSMSDIRLAVVQPNLDESGEYYFEHVAGDESEPLYADFDEDNVGVVIPTLAAGDMFGLWIRRRFNPEARKPLSEEALVAEVENPDFMRRFDEFSIDIQHD